MLWVSFMLGHLVVYKSAGSGRLLMVVGAIIVIGLLNNVQASVQTTITGAVTDQ